MLVLWCWLTLRLRSLCISLSISTTPLSGLVMIMLSRRFKLLIALRSDLGGFGPLRWQTHSRGQSKLNWKQTWISQTLQTLCRQRIHHRSWRSRSWDLALSSKQWPSVNDLHHGYRSGWQTSVSGDDDYLIINYSIILTFIARKSPSVWRSSPRSHRYANLPRNQACNQPESCWLIRKQMSDGYHICYLTE